MKFAKSILQVGYLYFVLFIGNSISSYLHIPIPGSIIGLGLLFLLLQFEIVKLEWIELGAGLLLSELLLFFIPSAIGVIDYDALLGVQGMKVIGVIVGSGIVVMLATGYIAEWFGHNKKGDVV